MKMIPDGYTSALSLYDTQMAIGMLKRAFEDRLTRALNVKRVSAPLFVDPQTGLNDNLNGTERPVSFDIPAAGTNGEVVHSLAKWKRMALYRYGFKPGEGLYTDMNAIRRDEEDLDDGLHSVYVDQWDWEKILPDGRRDIEYLKETVCAIMGALCGAAEEIRHTFPQLKPGLSQMVSFITTQDLEDLYPNLTSKERENAYVREHKTAFIMQIGDALRSGKPHDGRAPDYDDWTLNGDILVWSELHGCAVELSSMGIRVDSKTLAEQLKKAGCEDRAELPFHKMLLEGQLPLTIGGGIGQSRVCMVVLGKAHIGEVHSSIWSAETIETCKDAGIMLL